MHYLFYYLIVKKISIYNDYLITLNTYIDMNYCTFPSSHIYDN